VGAASNVVVRDHLRDATVRVFLEADGAILQGMPWRRHAAGGAEQRSGARGRLFRL
jgi:hypothetical protein